MNESEIPIITEGTKEIEIQNKQKNKRYRPWLFFLCTYLFTAIFWIPAAVMQKEMMEFPTIILYIIGGLAPSSIGILLTI